VIFSPAKILMVMTLVANPPRLSVTLKVILLAPAFPFGVPLTRPPAPRVRPAGRAPAWIDQVNGETPPVTASC